MKTIITIAIALVLAACAVAAREPSISEVQLAEMCQTCGGDGEGDDPWTSGQDAVYGYQATNYPGATPTNQISCPGGGFPNGTLYCSASFSFGGASLRIHCDIHYEWDGYDSDGNSVYVITGIYCAAG